MGQAQTALTMILQNSTPLSATIPHMDAMEATQQLLLAWYNCTVSL